MRREQAKDIKYLMFSLKCRILQVKLRETERRRVIARDQWGAGGWGHDGEMMLKGTNSQTPNVRCLYSRGLTYIMVTITDCMLYSKIVKEHGS